MRLNTHGSAKSDGYWGDKLIDAIINWILKLFGKKLENKKILRDNITYAKDYEDISDINFGAIFANSLANKTVTESGCSITGADGKTSKRADFINASISKIWDSGHKITAQAFGKGGIIIVPYIANQKAYADIVDQSRLFIASMQGDDIIAATILADAIVKNNRKYYRWTDYNLQNKTHIIKNRATDMSGAPIDLAQINEWANIQEELVIDNVDRILFAYLKNVIDNRKTKDYYGVPITYGSESIIKDIKECLEQISSEYELKRAFVGADDRLFDKNDKLPKNGLFKVLQSDQKDEFWEIFDPQIRDSSYFARLNQLFELLEKSIGTSKGIITPKETRGATATEILAAEYDTFVIVSNMRKNWEKAIQDLAYCYDVLAEYYALTPTGARGQYNITFDWDYKLYENSTETFGQLLEGHSRGAISAAELRQYIKSGETLEDAQKKVDEIKQKEPRLADLIGE